ncbi:MAG: hypothetical protein AVDCRST_MAG40-1566, partial [uncultured Gemmatimonadaceae bacterium]
ERRHGRAAARSRKPSQALPGA